MIENDSDDQTDQRYAEFLDLYTKNRDRIFRYIYALLPHQADAEDVFQRCSLLLWKNFSEYDRERPFSPWACSHAHYEVLNFLRSVRRDRLQFDEELVEKIAEARTRTSTESDVRLDALRRCLALLKSSDRELLETAYSGNTTIKDLAERKGLALQTLYNRMSLTRVKLLNCLTQRLAYEGKTS